MLAPVNNEIPKCIQIESLLNSIIAPNDGDKFILPFYSTNTDKIR